MSNVLTWVIAFGIAVFAVWLAGRLLSWLGRWLRAPQYKTAVKWAKRAAEHGSVESLGDLGVSYLKGQGVAEDPVEAFKWFTLARRKGDEEASVYLAALDQVLSADQKSEGNRRADAWLAERPEA